jgi:hypothetical protein
MDHFDESLEDLQLAKSLRGMQTTEKAKQLAHELKRFYENMPSTALKEFLYKDLPYTTEEYEKHKQRCDEIFLMD